MQHVKIGLAFGAQDHGLTIDPELPATVL